MKQTVFAGVARRLYRRPVAAMCLLLLAHTVCFTILEQIPRQVHLVKCSLDGYLPFVAEMIVPYLGWFLWVPAGLFYLLHRDKHRFWYCFNTLAAGIFITLALYAIWPTGLDLRGSVHGTDPFSLMVRLLYLVDTPTNVCPSLHVFISCVLLFALWGAVGRFGRLANGVLALAICASTVLLDQHSLVDVAMGLVLAAALWLAVTERHTGRSDKP